MISKTKSTGKGPFVREGSEHTSKLSAQRPAPKAGLAQPATLMEEILSPTCGQGPVLPMANPIPGTPGRVADGNCGGTLFSQSHVWEARTYQGCTQTCWGKPWD